MDSRKLCHAKGQREHLSRKQLGTAIGAEFTFFIHRGLTLWAGASGWGHFFLLV